MAEMPVSVGMRRGALLGLHPPQIRAALPAVVSSPVTSAPSEFFGGSGTELNVLFPFAGEHLKCNVKSCLGTLLSLMEGVVLNCEEWDTLRGKSYDLSVVQNQDDLDRQVAAGEFSIILMGRHVIPTPRFSSQTTGVRNPFGQQIGQGVFPGFRRRTQLEPRQEIAG